MIIHRILAMKKTMAKQDNKKQKGAGDACMMCEMFQAYLPT